MTAKFGELKTRMDAVMQKIWEQGNSNTPHARAWDAYMQQCQQMCYTWIDRYNTCRDQRKAMYLRSLEQLIKSYEGHMKIKSEQKEQRVQQTPSLPVEQPDRTQPQGIEQINRNTWALEIPKGATLQVKFDTYVNWQQFAPSTLRMGDMRTNGFTISRDPSNPQRVIIQSSLKFSWHVSGGVQRSFQKNTTHQPVQAVQNQADTPKPRTGSSPVHKRVKYSN